MAAGVALAAALPDLPHACGLGTVELLAGDVTANPLVPSGGHVAVRRPEPSPELLVRWAAPADRGRWWRDRLQAAHAAANW
jgi:O-succinylbenzoate synthase